MPSTKMSKNWALSDVLRQRRVLGLGILLAWLLLFHLLVNVWLLCIFTSLLVALGGWLGSRAVLDANSLLHLEHFLPLGKLSPLQCSPEHEWRLNHEIHNAVHKAVRDFVSSWYRTLLPEAEGEFERAVCSSMLESVMELKERARRVDRKALVQQLLQLYGCHLQSYMTARQIQSSEKESFSLWKLYSEVDTPHPAVKSPTEELRYSRALVNLFLHVLVPYPQMETRTGGYMVTELITCNVLLPLIHRVSDPDWLNQTILDIVTRSREPQEVHVNDPPGDPLYVCQNQRESWTTCRSQSSLPDGISSESTTDLHDVESWSSGCDGDSSCCSLVASGKGEHCKVNCCLASPHLLRSKMVLLDSLPSDSSDELTGGLCDCGPPANFCNLNLNDEENFGCFGPLKNLGPKAVAPTDTQWAAGVATEKTTTSPSRKPCVTANSTDASTRQASPVRMQNVHVSGAVAATEQRGSSTHPYTVYAVTVSWDISMMLVCGPQMITHHLSTSLRWWLRRKPAALCSACAITRWSGDTASSSTCKRA